MSRVNLPTVKVGDIVTLPQPRLPDFAHRHVKALFIILAVLVLAGGLEVAGLYWRAHITLQTNSKAALHLPAQPWHGPNTVVLTDQSKAAINQVSAQPITLSVAGSSVKVPASTIKSWLKTVDRSGITYIHVDQATISKSIVQLASPYIKAPTSQVSVTHPDGSALVIVAGHNGSTLGDTSPVAKQITQNLLLSKGMKFTLPTQPKPFASVTPLAFPKLIEVNLVSKQMYLYQNGKLVRQYAVSAGKPSTPTPIGQFQIFQKLPVQDMRGYNADGSKYFQPAVPWINYFLPGGFAIHGVYWHDLDWFGNINSSHGCVGLPVDEAAWVYNWAPVGTTIITHD